MKVVSLVIPALVLLTACGDDAAPAPPPDRVDGVDSGIEPAPIEPIAGDPLPPVSGGGLLVTDDDALAIVADASLDQVFVVDIEPLAVRATLELEAGDEPGRLVEDGAGHVHVALRRGGAVVSIDPRAGTILDRRAVCAAPRGIAYRASDDALIVACAEGELVFLPAAGGPVTARHSAPSDIRDVVVAEDDTLMVSRFRAAEVLLFDAAGETLRQVVTFPDSAPLRPTREPRPDETQVVSEAAVAWRMIAAGGGAYVLHQRATSGVLDDADEPRSEGSYGGGFEECDGVVDTATTWVGTDGSTSDVGTLARTALGVDLALSPSGDEMLVAAPGSNEAMVFGTTIADNIDAPTPTPSAFEPSVEAPMGTSVSTPPPDTIHSNCLTPLRVLPNPPELSTPVAVAWGQDNTTVAVYQAISRLVIVRPDGSSAMVRLSSEERSNTGFRIFHTATSAGLACASCHPEGGDDGRVWFFSGAGLRRTQHFAGALLGTEPFHWSGDMTSFEMLVHMVFEGRMSGPPLSDEQMAVFAQWLDSLAPPPRPEPTDPAAVARGEALFASAEVGCATCHAGPLLTNSTTVDVGTGGPLQVPSLIGVRYRAPYMHDGCASDFRARLTDATCGGGDMHGHTSDLDDAQLDDLVTYLETL